MEEMEISSHDRFAGYVHGQLGAVIGQLDTKASIVVGLSSATLIYLTRELNGLERAQTAVNSLGSLIDGKTINYASLLGNIPILITLILCAMAFVFGLLVIRPRFQSSPKTSLIFYNGIQRFRFPFEYADEVRALSREQLTSKVLEDAHALSKIAARKATYMAYAMGCFIVGVVMLGVNFLIGQV